MLDRKSIIPEKFYGQDSNGLVRGLWLNLGPYVTPASHLLQFNSKEIAIGGCLVSQIGFFFSLSLKFPRRPMVGLISNFGMVGMAQ
jgi:hypothetical protein